MGQQVLVNTPEVQIVFMTVHWTTIHRVFLRVQHNGGSL